MPQTLANLRLEAQQKCNQENKTLLSTSEWNRAINEAISELYDLILATQPHYYVSSFPFTLSGSNQQSIAALSPLLFKIRGLDYLWSTSNTRPMSVRPLNFAERNRFSSTNFSGNYNLWYSPVAPTLTVDGDTLDFILDVWAEYITVTAAITGATKEESPTEDLMAKKALQIDRINKSAATRDGEPGQAADLTLGSEGLGECGRRYMLEGSNLIVLGSDLGFWA